MQEVTRILEKYLLSALLLVFGLAFVLKYTNAPDNAQQPTYMLIGGIFCVVIAILAIPEIMGKLSKGLKIVFILGGILMAGFLLYANVNTIDQELDFLAEKDRYEEITVQRLKDIREVQLEHKLEFGTFQNDWDSLMMFIKAKERMVVTTTNDWLAEGNDTMMQKSEAERNSMTVGKYQLDSLGMSFEEAKTRGWMIKDTSYTSIEAMLFADEVRAEKDLPKVSLDSLFYNAKGDQLFLATGFAESGGVTQPTILVKDITPFGRPQVVKDTLMFGGLESATTDGTWGSK